MDPPVKPPSEDDLKKYNSKCDRICHRRVVSVNQRQNIQEIVRGLDRLCIVYYNIHMNKPFGNHIREKRESLLRKDARFSLRQVAGRVGMEPSYLSKLERGEQKALSEEKIIALDGELGEDPDVLLALTGKVSRDIQQIIRKRPQLFAQLIRGLKKHPDHAVLKIVRQVRDGK